MPNVIKLKNSGTPGAAPASLEAGEVAINRADGVMFYKNASNQIAALESRKVYVQSTQPTGSGPYLWVDTSDGDIQLWIETGE